MNVVRVVKQLSLFLPNEPGTLARMVDHLSKESVNILGLTVTDSIDHAVIRFVVDNHTKALHLLGELGALVIDTDVLAINMENRPGELMRLGALLSDANININYAYGGLAPNASWGVLYMRVSDTERSLALLSQEHI